MTISQNGINLIKKYEGCRLTAYKPVSAEKYWTIGWRTLWSRRNTRHDDYTRTSRQFTYPRLKSL